MDLTERFQWQGGEIAWARTGSGPATVFCHGTPWSPRVWAPFAAALARDFTVYLWDMPGYPVPLADELRMWLGGEEKAAV